MNDYEEALNAMQQGKTLADYPYPLYRRVAYPAVITPDGCRHGRSVVVYDCRNHPVAIFPLVQEEPFVEWRNMGIRLADAILT